MSHNLKCYACGKPAKCVGTSEGEPRLKPACGTCCAHGNEDGFCVPIRLDSIETILTHYCEVLDEKEPLKPVEAGDECNAIP